MVRPVGGHPVEGDMELVNEKQTRVWTDDLGQMWVEPPEVYHAQLRHSLEDTGLVTYAWIVEPRPNRWGDEWIEVVW